MGELPFDSNGCEMVIKTFRELGADGQRNVDRIRSVWRQKMVSGGFEEAGGIYREVKNDYGFREGEWEVGRVHDVNPNPQLVSIAAIGVEQAAVGNDFSSPVIQHNPLLHPNLLQSNAGFGSSRRASGCIALPSENEKRQKQRPSGDALWPCKSLDPAWRILGLLCYVCALICARWANRGLWPNTLSIILMLCLAVFCIARHPKNCEDEDEQQSERPIVQHQSFQHNSAIVPHKSLDSGILSGYSNYMANVLNTDKQIAIISQLAEGSSIRSIERITGVHRDTIMRLGVKVGKGCAGLMDAKMRDLSCNRLEMDEIWGFVGKKEAHLKSRDSRKLGSVWTFCAIDAETKLVPAFKVGDRNAKTAKAFAMDVASRMRNRVQVSTDGLTAYITAIEAAFGSDADYGQIVKVYGREQKNEHRYSAPEFVSAEKHVVSGNPDMALISTSYVERLNATTRLHMRRLTRLTLAFSKKRENFEAAVALHFAYYNFVKRHNTLRCTPAMAAGVAPTFWKVGDLLEAAA
jgi:IS1 family transposase